MPDASVVRFRQVVEVALRHLEARRQEINDLNVYPVADGDTGDNMAQTIGAVRQALAALEAQEVNASRERVVETVRRAALLGARGNSGAIASQIVRGAAEVLASQPGRLIDAQLVADALENAARAAREAVSKPTEGTILSVADAIAAAAREVNRRNPPETVSGPSDQDRILAELLAAVVAAGEDAVRRTPEQLQVLADADTVDAGAHALVILIRGMVAGLTGDEFGLPELTTYAPARIAGLEHGDSRYRWCLNLIIRGEGLVADAPGGLDALGDSIDVVGESTMLRVHVHTDDRAAVEALCAPLGEVHVDSCEDMHLQVAARAARAARIVGTAIVAVADGEGFHRHFLDCGCTVIDGGPTMNPSIAELLAAIKATGAEQVLILPNSPNVVMAAVEAGREARGAAVAVVESCVGPQIAAEVLAELERDGSAAELAERSAATVAALRVGSVAEAARADPGGRFAVGDAVGFESDQIIAWGDPAETLRQTIAHLIDRDAEVLSIFAGAEAPLSIAEVKRTIPPGLADDVRPGGQSAHWWLLAAQ